MQKEGYLITTNEYKHYKILVHNLVNMDTAYYLKEEDQLSPLSIEQMIKTNERKILHIKIEDIPEQVWPGMFVHKQYTKKNVLEFDIKAHIPAFF